ncbi:MAG: redoxin domain-containing protein [Prevotellaceae bacterium]|jgi:peroxiredoxin|nr:redoxin domain-containing protein [Prevotellaceae bacterium]
MKKKFIISISGLILLCVCGMLWYIVKTQYQREHFYIESLPDFTLCQSNYYPYNITNTDKAMVIVYFESDCQYCLNEAVQISENDDIFTKAQVYFISVESTDYLKNFESNFFSSQIIFLHDKEKDLYNALSVSNFPSVYLFTSDRKFIKRFIGFVSTEEIISHITNEQTD